MAELPGVCSRCNSDVNTQFNQPGGLRQYETITTHLYWNQPCFVRDIIEFKDSGQLIYQPPKERPGHEKGQPDFSVICRKLIINGGSKPIVVAPCNPGDPGTRYDSTNVITWESRLHAAQPGDPPDPKPAPAPDEVVGTDGAGGKTGKNGVDAPPKLAIFALEVEVLNNGHLVIDWGGQDGGDGGRGQTGGKGGQGPKGSPGEDESWPGSGCETATGTGGVGMRGGNGGEGGPGGNGGAAGQTVVISTPANLAGVFNGPNVIYINDGGQGGKGGKGGFHGDGGFGGPPGKKSSDCDAGQAGPQGEPGDDGNEHLAPGTPGAHQTPPLLREPAARGTCADKVPLPMVFDPVPTPHKICRCFAGPGSDDISITGQLLGQIDTVSTSLAGVTATKKPSSTDTQVDLKIQATAASATGVGNLVFKPALGSNQTLAGCIDVEKCQITSITPNAAARGSVVSTTISGQCFDVTGALHDVIVSGLGVEALNVAIVNDQTMTADIRVNANAAAGARDVTVKAGAALGPCQHTLIGGFTVT